VVGDGSTVEAAWPAVRAAANHATVSAVAADRSESAAT